MIYSRSKFYYGIEIQDSKIYIDFDDGLAVTAELFARSFSLASLAQEVSQKMSAAGSQAYTVTIDRNTRLCTISAATNFSLLLATGPNASNSALRALGFKGLVDLTGANSYTGDSPVGLVYTPQFYITGYKPSSSRQEAIDATINETGSGRIEVVRYGSRKFTQFAIDFVTNKPMPTDSWIETDTKGYDNLVAFLEWCIQKKVVEFMPDRNITSGFDVLQLERTNASSTGIGFDILEKDNFQDYFTSGPLVFRVV
jgi:hypothetical protein